MIYLLIIIIILLIYIAFLTPEKRRRREIKRVQKIFNTPLPAPKVFDVNDPRNKTHPEEMVRMKDGSLSHRKLAIMLEALQENLKK